MESGWYGEWCEDVERRRSNTEGACVPQCYDREGMILEWVSEGIHGGGQGHPGRNMCIQDRVREAFVRGDLGARSASGEAAGPGSSPMHISTETLKICIPERVQRIDAYHSWYDEFGVRYPSNREIDWREVTIAEGGEFVEAHGAKFASETLGRKGGERGVITEFTKESRRRLMRQIGKIPTGDIGMPVFLTMTYPEWVCVGGYSGGKVPGEWDGEKVHGDVNRFRTWLLREYPNAGVIWKMEFQENGSPHFHALIWRGPKILGKNSKGYTKGCNRPLFRKFGLAWANIVGEGMISEEHYEAGTRMERIKTKRGCFYYVSKYMGKNEVGGGKGWPGRFWGVLGRKNLCIRLRSFRVPTERWADFKRYVSQAVWESSKGTFQPVSKYWQGLCVMLDWRRAQSLLCRAMDGEMPDEIGVDCERGVFA